MVYTVRVVATNLITDTVSVCAKSEDEALAKAEQRIRPELKQDGYEFQLEVLNAPGLARLAPPELKPSALKLGNCDRIWPEPGWRDERRLS